MIGCCYQASSWISRHANTTIFCENKANHFRSNGSRCIVDWSGISGCWKSGSNERDLMYGRNKQPDLCGNSRFHVVLEASASLERKLHLMGEGDRSHASINLDHDSKSVTLDQTGKPFKSKDIANATSVPCKLLKFSSKAIVLEKDSSIYNRYTGKMIVLGSILHWYFWKYPCIKSAARIFTHDSSIHNKCTGKTIVL